MKAISLGENTVTARISICDPYRGPRVPRQTLGTRRYRFLCRELEPKRIDITIGTCRYAMHDQYAAQSNRSKQNQCGTVGG